MSLFRKSASKKAAEALYAAAVEQARSVSFYAEYGAPDTVQGRFEMVSLHVFLVLRRLSQGDSAAKRVSQSLFDAMFRNMDDSLREMGVGDLSVGRKIRKMAENFYGRAAAYEEALKSPAGEGALSAALGRNVYGDAKAAHASKLARYVRAAAAAIDEQPIDRLTGGVVQFRAASA